MEVLTVFIVGILVLVAGFEAYMRVQDRKEATKIQTALIDRVLAPDFNTFKMHEASIEAAKVDKKPLTAEEIQDIQDDLDAFPM